MVVGVVALVCAAGGIVAFSFIADSIEFFARGYRVKWLDPTRCSYQERLPDGSVVCLPLLYKPLRKEYRPPCEVHLPSEREWNQKTPDWARDRRREIIGHIGRCLGAEFGRQVQFIDPVAID